MRRKDETEGLLLDIINDIDSMTKTIQSSNPSRDEIIRRLNSLMNFAQQAHANVALN